MFNSKKETMNNTEIKERLSAQFRPKKKFNFGAALKYWSNFNIYHYSKVVEARKQLKTIK